METLSQLATKYGTDKQEKDHNYMHMYQKMLGTITIKKFLEIGLGTGKSMRMWLEYYPDADVYCMENFGTENKKVWGGATGDDIEGLNLITGDSTKEEAWRSIPDDLDVIIDDGEHHPDVQIATFLLGFNHMRQGGLYFIEDLHCNFTELYTGGHDIIYKWLFNLIISQQTPALNFGGDFYKARSHMSTIAKSIYSYHFYKSMIIFEKA